MTTSAKPIAAAAGTPLRAFHNKKSVKAKYIDRVRAHRAAAYAAAQRNAYLRMADKLIELLKSA